MNYGAIKTEYLHYLMNRIGVEAEGRDGYLHLCSLMQETPFVPLTDMDSNRCGECRELRSDFSDAEYGAGDAIDILDGIYSESGTMLELMTVLAEKMAYETSLSQYEASTRKWFLELLGNCGLDTCALNETLTDEHERDKAKGILARVIFRKFGWDGEGGIFPLVYAQYDQRRVELLVQMNNYLEENYDI